MKSAVGWVVCSRGSWGFLEGFPPLVVWITQQAHARLGLLQTQLMVVPGQHSRGDKAISTAEGWPFDKCCYLWCPLLSSEAQPSSSRAGTNPATVLVRSAMAAALLLVITTIH